MDVSEELIAQASQHLLDANLLLGGVAVERLEKLKSERDALADIVTDLLIALEPSYSLSTEGREYLDKMRMALTF